MTVERSAVGPSGGWSVGRSGGEAVGQSRGWVVRGRYSRRAVGRSVRLRRLLSESVPVAACFIRSTSLLSWDLARCDRHGAELMPLVAGWSAARLMA